jgi:hypothetical protein
MFPCSWRKTFRLTPSPASFIHSSDMCMSGSPTLGLSPLVHTPSLSRVSSLVVFPKHALHHATMYGTTLCPVLLPPKKSLRPRKPVLQ